MFYDKPGSYTSLCKYSYTTLDITWIKTIASKVFKSLNNLNPTVMLDVKDISNGPRDSEFLFS